MEKQEGPGDRIKWCTPVGFCTCFVLVFQESKIAEFLSRVASLPLGSMTEEEFQAQLDGMRRELAAVGDAHISDIIGRV